MTDEYQALREAAEHCAKYFADIDWAGSSHIVYPDKKNDPEDYYIAAASPDVILKLLDRIAELEAHPPLSLDARIAADNAALREMLASHQWVEDEIDEYCPECDSSSTYGHKPDCELRALLETSA